MESLVIYPQGSRQEVPPGVPDDVWLDAMRELAGLHARDEILAELDWWHPVMEYLEPSLLLRLKVQVLVWRQFTGEFPNEVACWWPVRLGRRPVCRECNYRSNKNTERCFRCGSATEPAQVPHLNEWATMNIDEQGILHCGFCGARWSPSDDGSPQLEDDRCKLCDRQLVEVTV